MMSVTKIMDRREEVRELWTLEEGTWFTFGTSLYQVCTRFRNEVDDVKVMNITDRLIYSSSLPPKTVVCPVDVTIFHRPSQSKEQPFKE